MLALLWESSVLLDEADDAAQSEPALSALGAVVCKPASIRVSTNSRRAHAEQAAGLLEREFGIEQTSNELTARLLELTTIVICRDVVGEELAQELDVLRQVLPDILQIRIDRNVVRRGIA